MKEIFENKQRMEAERPLMVQSPAWWSHKAVEEAGELAEATSNDPTPEELVKMKSEASDLLLCYIGFMRSIGVGAEESHQLALNKIDEISERYPAHHFNGSNFTTFEEAYRHVRPDKHIEINVYNGSVNLEEDPRLTD